MKQYHTVYSHRVPLRFYLMIGPFVFEISYVQPLEIHVFWADTPQK